MPRPLSLLTVLFVALALGFAGLIARELTKVRPTTAVRSQPSASPASAQPAAHPAPAPANYTVVASRNLFSPTRSEAPPAPPTPPPAPPPLPKPGLFGVILVEGTPVAYLEDPVSKRVARYRVGDSVAGGTVKAIESDTVLLLRPDGQVTVRLHDPARPRPAAPGTPTPAAGAAPGVNQPQHVPTMTQPFRPMPTGVPGRAP